MGVARFALALLRGRPNTESRLFDPRDLALGDLDTREWERDARPPALVEFVREMGRADGFVLVTPEYNHSFPGALKNMVDHLYDE
ncbi:MAG: NAD(P)H-dependent oxidoreductase, partial [Thermoplasmata archaeon]|nr:NAD(P)H-dependent oxidoreductase [Thermoplasmata archaeon]